jgi:outer membrane protein OmpA-like peptidoglycan-associated protein
MRYLIFIIWLILGLFYWKCHNECCHQSTTTHEAESKVSSIDPLPISIKKLTPIRFNCSDSSPDTETNWEKFKDSLIVNLADDDILEINGYYYSDESYSGTIDLGHERAQNVLNLLTDLPSARTRISSRVKGDSCIHAELNNLITFRYARNTAKIKEIDDKTIIYFPYGSTKKIDDAEVESYLDEVISRIKDSGEKVILTGHTDNDGSSSFNIELGERRAVAVQDYFIKKGITPSKVIVRSKGETEPIASNDSEEGRAKNRRTELQILK